jgi:hypothetical protein
MALMAWSWTLSAHALLRAVVAAETQQCHRGRLLRAAEQGDDDKWGLQFLIFFNFNNTVSDIGSGNIAKVIENPLKNRGDRLTYLEQLLLLKHSPKLHRF